jgi:hypothetical protein
MNSTKNTEQAVKSISLKLLKVELGRADISATGKVYNKV